MAAPGSRTWTGAGVLLVTALATGVIAQTKPREAPAALRSLIDCRAITENSARLACYDAAVGQVSASLDKGDIIAVDRDQARKVRRQAFGFAIPSLSLFERGEASGDLDQVTLPVESASRGADGKWTIRLEGQTWRQIDTEEFSREPRAGLQATIQRARLGSYLMTIGGHGAVRVKRQD